MSQLIVNDLDFCQTEQSKVKGGWLSLDADVDAYLDASPPYGLGYSQGYGYAVGIGNNADGTPPNAFVNITTGGFTF